MGDDPVPEDMLRRQSVPYLSPLSHRYTFELAYVEKKAAKFKRRHRRRKHTIPWHKIKIVGPVLNCGANSLNKGTSKGTTTGKASGGKCPMGFTSDAAPATAAKDKRV